MMSLHFQNFSDQAGGPAGENPPDAILLVNQSGTIDRINEKMTELFGYSAGELLGRSVELLMPERYRARHGHHLAAYFATPHARTMGAGLELHGQRDWRNM